MHLSWKRRFRRLGVAMFLALAAFAAILAYNALVMPSRQQRDVPPVDVPNGVDRDAAAKRLVGFLTPLTIASPDADKLDTAPFEKLHALFAASYPLVHARLSREFLGNPPVSLLYTWRGTDESLPAVLLMSHLDVVPIDPATKDLWDQSPDHPAFDGTFVWGRGALDVKSGAAAMLEAVELLLADDFVPQRTIYLAMGHDEEVGGMNGNRVIAETLRKRNVSLQCVLDEGGAILDGVIGGMSQPVAFVAVAEKGVAVLTITAHGSGGHGSVQSDQSAVSRLARALHRIEDHPLPADLDQGTNVLLEFLGPEMPFGKRLIVANRWCFDPLIVASFAAQPTTNAVIRTTTSFTGLESGFVANGIPQQAVARVDVRMLPGDSVEDVKRFLQQLVDDPVVVKRLSDDDRGVVVEVSREMDRTATISATDSTSFQVLQRTIHQLYGDCVVAAGVTAVATDSRYYAGLTNDILRFIPLRMKREDLQRVHGVNERIDADHYVDIIRFFAQLLRNSAQ